MSSVFVLHAPTISSFSIILILLFKTVLTLAVIYALPLDLGLMCVAF